MCIMSALGREQVMRTTSGASASASSMPTVVIAMFNIRFLTM